VTTGPDLPLACTLDAAAFAERRARWEALAERALAGRESTPGSRGHRGIRLTSPAGA
jgi:hypothetical protein